jgi:triosephosphate isomerase
MEMKFYIIINFKTYRQGKATIKLAKEIQKIDKNIIIGVQPEEVALVSKSTKLEVFSEHCDYQTPGKNTGFILPEGLKAVGAKGVFLNHSEHPISITKIEKTVKHCKKVGLKTAVFADTLEHAIKIKKFRPDFLIIEPPELVGGEKSITTARQGLIKSIKRKLKYPFIVGAGIRDNHDIILAGKLGSSGVALSSAIMTSKKPSLVLKKLLGR